VSGPHRGRLLVKLVGEVKGALAAAKAGDEQRLYHLARVVEDTASCLRLDAAGIVVRPLPRDPDGRVSRAAWEAWDREEDERIEADLLGDLDLLYPDESEEEHLVRVRRLRALARDLEVIPADPTDAKDDGRAP
jgi:hypothetical protein